MPVAYLEAKPPHFLHGVYLDFEKGTACEFYSNAKLIVKVDHVTIFQCLIYGNSNITSTCGGFADSFFFGFTVSISTEGVISARFPITFSAIILVLPFLRT